MFWFNNESTIKTPVIIQGQQINYSAGAYWCYKYCRSVTFASSIHCDVANLTHDLLRRIYICMVAALRFCLGRSNTSLEVGLKQNTSDSWDRIGEFRVLQNPTRIPDEFDKLHIALIHASDIGTRFDTVISAFASNELTAPDLPQSRTDANNYISKNHRARLCFQKRISQDAPRWR